MSRRSDVQQELDADNSGKNTTKIVTNILDRYSEIIGYTIKLFESKKSRKYATIYLTHCIPIL